MQYFHILIRLEQCLKPTEIMNFIEECDSISDSMNLQNKKTCRQKLSKLS